ncbi:glycosyltransferase family 4 protein [Pseudomonadota bacterium]
MRICVVTPSKIGPTETFIRAHIERLPHDIECLHGYWLDYTWNERKLREWYLDAHPEQSRRWLNLLPRFLEFRIRRRFIQRATDLEVARDFLQSKKIDVVLAEYGTAGGFIAPVCKSTGIPLIVHFHGFDASRYRILDEFRDAYKELFSYASAVISVSAAMSEDLIDMGCPGEKICYNPYGPDSSFGEILPDYSSNMLIAVGRHTSKKAPYLTLDAFRIALRSCPSLRLCIVGDGELFEVSERLVRAWSLEQKVDLVGKTEPEKIRQIMERAFAFVQHSIKASDGDSEGMPVAILEAGLAGLPVISTRHAGIPEAVIDGQTGYLIEPGNSRDMAERIVELANDRKLTKNMGAKARAHIRENFSMSRHIATLDRTLCEANSD